MAYFIKESNQDNADLIHDFNKELESHGFNFSLPVKVAFINLQGTTLELLEPLDETSPIYNNLKNNNKLCHICFEVSNIDNAINNGEKKGFHVIQKPVPAVALGNRKICFLFHSDYHIVELLQR